jgi:transposase, IS6 family
VKGEWRYLYRAVDSSGATIDFLLSAKQNAPAAVRFFAKRWAGKTAPLPGSSTPTVTPLIRLQSLELKSEGTLDSCCEHRPVPYLE